MMAMRLMLSLLVGACLYDLVSAGCRSGIATSDSGCHSGGYSGPVPGVIRDHGTLLARKTAEGNDRLINGMKAIIRGTIGLLPGGAFVSGLFTAIGEAVGEQGQSTATILTELYNDLASEINDLRRYVDDRIEQATTGWLQQQLGDATGGLYGVAKKCEDKTGTGLKTCLNSLHTQLVSDNNHFLPSTGDIASYERTLPLFRHFGDLFLSTLVSEIAVEKELGNTAQAATKTTELRNKVTQFKTHFEVTALPAIVADHSRLNVKNCCTSNMWLGWWAFAQLAYYLGECTTSGMGGSNCKTRAEVGCNGYNGVSGKNKALQVSRDNQNSKRSSFVNTRRSQLTDYWNDQIGAVVDKWEKISEASLILEKVLLMSVTEEERRAIAIITEAQTREILGTDQFSSHQSDEDSLAEARYYARQYPF